MEVLPLRMTLLIGIAELSKLHSKDPYVIPVVIVYSSFENKSISLVHLY